MDFITYDQDFPQSDSDNEFSLKNYLLNLCDNVREIPTQNIACCENGAMNIENFNGIPYPKINQISFAKKILQNANIANEQEESSTRIDSLSQKDNDYEPEEENFQEKIPKIQKKGIKKATKKPAKAPKNPKKQGKKGSNTKKREKSKNSQKRVKYTTKSEYASSQKKNAGGTLRERIMKCLKATVSYEDETLILKENDSSHLEFMRNHISSLSDDEKVLLCKFFKQYDSNNKDHKKIKNRKNLKAIVDMCEQFEGGVVFSGIIKNYLEEGGSNRKLWIETYHGNVETKDYIRSGELYNEVKKYMAHIWIQTL